MQEHNCQETDQDISPSLGSPSNFPSEPRKGNVPQVASVQLLFEALSQSYPYGPIDAIEEAISSEGSLLLANIPAQSFNCVEMENATAELRFGNLHEPIPQDINQGIESEEKMSQEDGKVEQKVVNCQNVVSLEVRELEVPNVNNCQIQTNFQSNYITSHQLHTAQNLTQITQEHQIEALPPKDHTPTLVLLPPAIDTNIEDTQHLFAKPFIPMEIEVDHCSQTQHHSTLPFIPMQIEVDTNYHMEEVNCDQVKILNNDPMELCNNLSSEHLPMFVATQVMELIDQPATTNSNFIQEQQITEPSFPVDTFTNEIDANNTKQLDSGQILQNPEHEAINNCSFEVNVNEDSNPNYLLDKSSSEFQFCQKSEALPYEENAPISYQLPKQPLVQQNITQANESKEISEGNEAKEGNQTIPHLLIEVSNNQQEKCIDHQIQDDRIKFLPENQPFFAQPCNLPQQTYVLPKSEHVCQQSNLKSEAIFTFSKTQAIQSYQNAIEVINLESQSSPPTPKKIQEVSQSIQLQNERLQNKNQLSGSFHEMSPQKINWIPKQAQIPQQLISNIPLGPKCINFQEQLQHNHHEPNSYPPIPSITPYNPDKAAQQSEQMNRYEPLLNQEPNVIIHNDYHRCEKPACMQTLQNKKLKEVAVPIVPPCITISINRYNEISLNIFNNHSLERLSQMKQKEEVCIKIPSNGNQTSLESVQIVQRPARLDECKNEKRNTQNASAQITHPQNPHRCNESSLPALSDHSPYHHFSSADSPPQQLAPPLSIILPPTVVTLPERMVAQQSPQQIYAQICDYADKYLLKGRLEESDHLKFQQILKPHIKARLTTEPISEVGELMFKNGLVLVAIVKLFARNTTSPFLAHYIFEYLSSSYIIEHNQYIFQEQTVKARTIYHKYLQQQFYDQYTKVRLADPEHQPVVRRSIQIKQPVLNNHQNQIAIQQLQPNPSTVSFQSNFHPYNQKIIVPPTNSPLSQANKPQEVPKDRIEISLKINPQASINEKVSQTESDDYHKNKGNADFQDVMSNDKATHQVPHKYPMGKDSLTLKKLQGKDSNILDYPSTGIKSNDSIINPSSRFSELYEKYRKIRETKRVSEQISGTPNSSILKSTSPQEKGEEKKKRHVQFVDEVTVANKEENIDQDFGRPKRKRKSKCRVESYFEEPQADELPRKKRTSKN